MNSPDVFRDPFSSELELLFEPSDADLKLPHINCADPEASKLVINPSKPNPLLALPKELRDEIYQYALPSDKAFVVRLYPRRRSGSGKKQRLEERLPLLYYALPLLHREILAVHYRVNTIRYIAGSQGSRAVFIEWMRRRGDVLVKNLRRLEIDQRFRFSIPCKGFGPPRITTRLFLQRHGKAEIEHNHHVWFDACSCSIEALVQERLSRRDVLRDCLPIRGIEESTEYGPVFRLALQLLQAVNFDDMLQAEIATFSEVELWEANRNVNRECEACGKLKWPIR